MLSHPPTPIPLGSPLVENPPMFDRWGLLSDDVQQCDRRTYSRRRVDYHLWLIDIATETVMRCQIDDISDAGLHAKSPIGFGLAVGQRFEARVANTHNHTTYSSQMAPSLGYVTIVRLEFDVRREDSHRIGFAIRFDVPQLVPV